MNQSKCESHQVLGRPKTEVQSFAYIHAPRLLRVQTHISEIETLQGVPTSTRFTQSPIIPTSRKLPNKSANLKLVEAPIL